MTEHLVFTGGGQIKQPQHLQHKHALKTYDKVISVLLPGQMEMILHHKRRSEDIQMRCELLCQPQGQTEEECTQKELSELGIEEYMILNPMFRIIKEVFEVSCECYNDDYPVNHIRFEIPAGSSRMRMMAYTSQSSGS
jgi:hypothetical protein